MSWNIDDHPPQSRCPAVMPVPSLGATSGFLLLQSLQKKCYINGKHFPSVLLQGICDAKGTFLEEYNCSPGTAHDALVLHRSTVFKQALYQTARYFIL